MHNCIFALDLNKMGFINILTEECKNLLMAGFFVPKFVSKITLKVCKITKNLFKK